MTGDKESPAQIAPVSDTHDAGGDTAIERLVSLSVRNPMLVFLFVVLGIVAGIFSIFRMPLDALPDLSDVQVIVRTEWEGCSPNLVEDQITYPLSAKFVGAPKVKVVRGESMFGQSFVYIIFEEGTDIYWARSRVIESLNSLREALPEGAYPVVGPDAASTGWVFQYALVDDSGKHDLAQLRSLQDWNLRYSLESVKGVAEVAPIGGFVKEFQIDIDPNKLVVYALALNDVIEAVRKGNIDAGGGSLEIATTQFVMRGRGKITSIRDLENVVLKTHGGAPIYLKNVGQVHLGPGVRFGVADLNGEGETVGGIVIMRAGENALKVIDGVKRRIEEVKDSLPQGVRIVPVYDRSILIYRAVGTLREKLIEESLVVAAICVLFLLHVRSAFVAICLLPIAIVLSFVPMSWLGVTSNIMSLGGIAIAIGALVDAAIIMIESAHKGLERFREEHQRDPTDRERKDVIVRAAQRVGRPLFFSMLVMTVSFVPVLGLEAQEGRLFRPLALAKTFAMLFASTLGVLLVPVLMVWLIRGRIVPESRNPISAFFLAAYGPLVNMTLRFPYRVIAGAAILLLLTWIPFSRLGKEFMPPLNEGSLLYMPAAVPGMAIGEAVRILQIQDRILKQFPEVESVLGKAGQADTATDPAPLSMFETTVQLKPAERWRDGMTWERLIREMDAATETPGMAQVFWMPIQTRIEMLTTGFRSVLGIKILGQTAEQIDAVARSIEGALRELPDTRGVLAERATDGYFLDFVIKREAAARYGLNVEDVNQVLEVAIGGKVVGATAEGRERYPIVVRYARDFRDNIEALKRVLVTTPNGEQVPMSLLADLEYGTGAPNIRSENGQLVGYVSIDIEGRDIDGYVKAASQRIKERVQFPPGCYFLWAGQFEQLQSAERHLAILVPITLLMIFILVYLSTRSLVKTLIVFLTVPFSLVGAFWLLYVLGYNLSPAVWVGLIALAGVDAQTGVVMLLYLDMSWEKFKAEGRMNSLPDLYAAVREGAVQRIRPKMMAVCAILLGLLPIMWSPEYQAGADMMKRIATPMVGGVISSALLNLLVYPVIYVIWRKRYVRKTVDA
jgi:copper/silver efflux system protein